MTSSVSATQPTPYETTYGPSRAFVTCSPESLHAEVLEAQSRAWVNEEEG
jgi:short-subunit dehydrogenase